MPMKWRGPFNYEFSRKTWGVGVFFHRFFVGVFLVILSGICYGFAPILAVYAYRGGATVSMYVFLRYGIASVFFLIYIAIYKRNIFRMVGKIPVALLLAAGTSQAVASYLYMATV
ncbi:MAG: hypothetical protein RJR35_09250, partial [Thermoanaerobacterales bacterium]|nr:hypothetical protein [Thermoanaerobacterales bacterium]